MLLGGYQIVDLKRFSLTCNDNFGILDGESICDVVIVNDGGDVVIDENQVIKIKNDFCKFLINTLRSEKFVYFRNLTLTYINSNKKVENESDMISAFNEAWVCGYHVKNFEISSQEFIDQWFLITHFGILELTIKEDFENLKPQFKLYNRFFSDDSIPFKVAEDLYVNVTGDTMTGDLKMMSCNIKIENGSLHVTYGDVKLNMGNFDITNGNINVIGGQIDMHNNEIINLADPVNPQDALNLRTADDRYVNESGDTMTGDLTMESSNINVIGGQIDMHNGRVIDVGDPIGDKDAISKRYADDRYVNETGDTMTGNLNMSGKHVKDLNSNVAQYTLNDAISLKRALYINRVIGSVIPDSRRIFSLEMGGEFLNDVENASVLTYADGIDVNVMRVNLNIKPNTLIPAGTVFKIKMDFSIISPSTSDVWSDFQSATYSKRPVNVIYEMPRGSYQETIFTISVKDIEASNGGMIEITSVNEINNTTPYTVPISLRF